MTGVYLRILTMSHHGSRSYAITLCQGVVAGYTTTPDERHVHMYMSCHVAHQTCTHEVGRRGVLMEYSCVDEHTAAAR